MPMVQRESVIGVEVEVEVEVELREASMYFQPTRVK